MIYAITATLNGLPYTKQLLVALQGGSFPVHVVVVDNASTDGTPDWIAGLRRKDGRPAVAGGLTLVAQQRNTGVAAAWNAGLRIALQNRADKILVCGNDTRPMPGTVERLAALVDEGVHFVTGTTVPYDKPEGAVAPGPRNELLLVAPDFSFFMLTPAAIEAVARCDRALELELAAAPGAERPAVLLNPWDWGLFDERFHPASYEDNDYCLRLLRAGLIPVRDPGAEFRHETSLTVRINPEVQKETYEAAPRNADLFKAKWGRLPHELDPVPPHHLRPIVARPPYMTDEQWRQFGGDHPVPEVRRADAARQAALKSA